MPLAIQRLVKLDAMRSGSVGRRKLKPPRHYSSAESTMVLITTAVPRHLSPGPIVLRRCTRDLQSDTLLKEKSVFRPERRLLVKPPRRSAANRARRFAPLPSRFGATISNSNHPPHPALAIPCRRNSYEGFDC
ncbi:unnamed protein product, partial [Iphiclides podalirius]